MALAVATLGMSSPVFPPILLGQESVLLLFGAVYSPVLVAGVAGAVNLSVEVASYHLHRTVLDLEAARDFRESRPVRTAVKIFEARPGLAVWLCSWSPLPYFVVRALSPLAGYPLQRHLLATAAGRLPKYLLIAYLGYAWRPRSKWVIAGVCALVAAGGVSWAIRRIRKRSAEQEGDRSPPPGPDPTGSRPGLRTDGREGPESPSDEPVPVLYVAASGRSGSTLVDRTLGGIDGLVSTGELSRLFGRGLDRRGWCGCGAPVTECPLWTSVLDRLRERGHRLDLEGAAEMRDRVAESPRMARVLFPDLLPGRDDRLRRYQRLVADTYRAIRRASGARVVVDSSKNPIYGLLLHRTAGLRVHVLHLVRDSRGVLHSWQKKKRALSPAEEDGDRRLMPRHGTLEGAAIWSAAQLSAEFLGSRAASYRRIRYRTFVRRPRRTTRLVLRGITGRIGHESLPHIRADRVRLAPQHVVAANPTKMETGWIPLEEDRAWQSDMSAGRRLLALLLTLPVLVRYRPGEPPSARTIPLGKADGPRPGLSPRSRRPSRAGSSSAISGRSPGSCSS